MIDIKTLKLTALFRSGDSKAGPQSTGKAEPTVHPKDATRKDSMLSLGQPTVAGVRKLVDKL